VSTPNTTASAPFKFSSPEAAFKAARRRIVNNALRREQRSLDLSHFGLVDLSPEIGQLKSLRTLNISNNQIVSLPAEIGGLSAIATANMPPDTLQLVMLFLKSNSADILSFAAPFPELRLYMNGSSIISTSWTDHRNLKIKQAWINPRGMN
jgi:hypothetical protein